MIFAGIGCSSQCSADEIVALVRQAMLMTDAALSGLATSEARASLPAVQRAAAELGLALRAFGHGTLAAEQARCMSFSEAARRATGLGAIAEAAALAAAGAGGRLLLPRISSGRATCAVAVAQVVR